jgi:hypothetical protein
MSLLNVQYLLHFCGPDEARASWTDVIVPALAKRRKLTINVCAAFEKISSLQIGLLSSFELLVKDKSIA